MQKQSYPVQSPPVASGEAGMYPPPMTNDGFGREKEQTMQSKSSIRTLVVYGVLILLGVGTGYLLSRSGGVGVARTPSAINTEKVVGVDDTKTFKDSAEGVLEAGGIDGEGTHKLIRDGGPSQTAYLFSSVVDLDQHIGKKVKVWGQTYAAKKAAWLMDVGKIELLE